MSTLVSVLCLPLPSLHAFNFYEIFLLLVNSFSSVCNFHIIYIYIYIYIYCLSISQVQQLMLAVVTVHLPVSIVIHSTKWCTDSSFLCTTHFVGREWTFRVKTHHHLPQRGKTWSTWTKPTRPMTQPQQGRKRSIHVVQRFICFQKLASSRPATKHTCWAYAFNQRHCRTHRMPAFWFRRLVESA